jgi:hypothetical protein
MWRPCPSISSDEVCSDGRRVQQARAVLAYPPRPGSGPNRPSNFPCVSGGSAASRARAAGLIPPAYVKPYVKRQKNDTADAEAICEAVTRPNMRFVPIKTIEQQGCLVLHRTRHLLVRQHTATINSIRAYLAEFGIVAPVGRRGLERLLEVIADANVLPLSGSSCGSSRRRF